MTKSVVSSSTALQAKTDLQIGILNGVLSLNDKKANELMTPIDDCLTLSADTILDHEKINQILLSGFSRIPIHEPGQRLNFIGMLLVKRVSLVVLYSKIH